MLQGITNNSAVASITKTQAAMKKLWMRLLVAITEAHSEEERESTMIALISTISRWLYQHVVRHPAFCNYKTIALSSKLQSTPMRRDRALLSLYIRGLDLSFSVGCYFILLTVEERPRNAALWWLRRKLPHGRCCNKSFYRDFAFIKQYLHQTLKEFPAKSEVTISPSFTDFLVENALCLCCLMSMQWQLMSL